MLRKSITFTEKNITYSRKIYPLDKKITNISDSGKRYYYRQESNKIYWNTLAHYLAEFKAYPAKNPKNIISIGCGEANEFPVLSSFFSFKNTFRYYKADINIYGLDFNQEIINKAAKKYLAYDNFNFVCSDMAAMDRLANLPNKYELIIYRHPMLLDKAYRNAFAKNIDQAINSLIPGGLVILTTYLKEEHEILLDFLNKHTFGRYFYKKNIFGKRLLQPNDPCDPDPLIQDGYITVIKK